MNTYSTTATVENGRLTVQLPAEFEGHIVSIQVSDTGAVSEESGAEQARRLAAFYELVGSIKGIDSPANQSTFSREEMYDDDGRF